VSDKEITAADLKAAKWTPHTFASSRGFHRQDYACAEYPRLIFRIERDDGVERKFMLVDGDEVGGLAKAAEILNAGGEQGIA
jgi:hypothetical protein